MLLNSLLPGFMPNFSHTSILLSFPLLFNSNPLNKVFWNIFWRFHLSYIHFNFVPTRYPEKRNNRQNASLGTTQKLYFKNILKERILRSKIFWSRLFWSKRDMKLGFDSLCADEFELLPCTPFTTKLTISNAQVLRAVKNGVSTVATLWQNSEV